MPRVLDPFRFVLIAIAGWMNQRQLQMIDYLREENRVLREQLGGRRLRLNDDQRRRLAAKAKGIMPRQRYTVLEKTPISPEVIDSKRAQVKTEFPSEQFGTLRNNHPLTGMQFLGPIIPGLIRTGSDASCAGNRQDLYRNHLGSGLLCGITGR